MAVIIAKWASQLWMLGDEGWTVTASWTSRDERFATRQVYLYNCYCQLSSPPECTYTPWAHFVQIWSFIGLAIRVSCPKPWPKHHKTCALFWRWTSEGRQKGDSPKQLSLPNISLTVAPAPHWWIHCKVNTLQIYFPPPRNKAVAWYDWPFDLRHCIVIRYSV